MASLYLRGAVWWIKFRSPSGELRRESLGTKDRKTALEFQRRIEQVEAEVRAKGMTFRKYAEAWLDDREALGVQDASNERQRLRDHVYPHFGDMALNGIEASDLKRWAVSLRKDRSKNLAPKTIRNIYGVIRSVMRSATVDGLVTFDPCILTAAELGKNKDKDPYWRHKAFFNKGEVLALIASPELPEAHRVANALAALAGLRQGEVCALRWSDIESRQPLPALVISRSHQGTTKTEQTRQVPMHPVLGEVLAHWAVYGWRELVGRRPQLDDLVVPAPKTKRGHAGRQLTKSMIYKGWRRDLEALQLRQRRYHDLRRTFVSLALADGARRDVLERVSHQALATRAIDLYTTLPWEVLCEEVLKLELEFEPPESWAQSGHSALESADSIGEIVEAPGVEPGSEDVSPSGVYVCIRLIEIRSSGRRSAVFR